MTIPDRLGRSGYVRMCDDEARKDTKLKRKNSKVGRDIDIEDGTGKRSSSSRTRHR